MVTIRDSAEPDIPHITAIYARHVANGTATFETEPPDEREIGRRRAALTGAGYPHIVAEMDGVIVGFACAGPYRPRAAYRLTVEDSVYVQPGRTGQGIGRALLAALIRKCESGPWRQMIAVIGDSDNAASIRLHEAAGFRHAGILASVGLKFGRWLDVVLMQRALGDPSSGG
jgi:phosphinothricin acetyltransferase